MYTVRTIKIFAHPKMRRRQRWLLCKKRPLRRRRGSFNSDTGSFADPTPSTAERRMQRHVPGRIPGKTLRALPLVVIHAGGDGDDKVQARDDVEALAGPSPSPRRGRSDARRSSLS